MTDDRTRPKLDVRLTIEQERDGQDVQDPLPFGQVFLVLTVQRSLDGLRIDEEEEQPGGDGEHLQRKVK
jgi:hypothetical protein